MQEIRGFFPPAMNYMQQVACRISQASCLSAPCRAYACRSQLHLLAAYTNPKPKLQAKLDPAPEICETSVNSLVKLCSNIPRHLRTLGRTLRLHAALNVGAAFNLPDFEIFTLASEDFGLTHIAADPVLMCLQSFSFQLVARWSRRCTMLPL